MATRSIHDVRAELDRLRQQEAQLIEQRIRKVGTMAARAGALELPDDIILGALLTAVEDDAAAVQFQAQAKGRFRRRDRRRGKAAQAATAARAPTGEPRSNDAAKG